MNKELIEFAYKSGLFEGSEAVPFEHVERYSKLIIDRYIRICLDQRDPPNLNYKPSVAFAHAIKLHFNESK